MKWNRHFGAIDVSAAQQICHGVAESFASFKTLRNLFKQSELHFKPHFKPRPPQYRKAGLFTLSYPKRWLKLTDPGIRCPLGRAVKCWFGINTFYIPMPSNLDWDSIRELRILPHNGCFYAEFVYPTQPQRADVDPHQAFSGSA